MRDEDDELAVAIESGDSKQVARIIESPSFNFRTEINTRIGPTLATVLAVARGRREILELLLNAGANVNDCDRLGKTPCYAAVQWARTELVALLIARGAALHNTHHSLLSMSSSLSTDDISLLLIESGAPLDDVDAVCRVAGHSVAVARLLLARNVNLRDLRDNRGRSVLHYACEGADEHLDVAEMLVREVGINPSARDNGDQTPAHMCALFSSQRILQRLIDFGADIDYPEVEFAITPLHYALSRGFSDAVVMLVAAGADVHAVNSMSQSMCHVAVTSTPLAFAAVLAAGVSIDTRDRDGVTPRELAQIYNLALPSDSEVADARRRIAATQLALVRERALQVCVGLAALDLDALRMCEILLHACGIVAPMIGFHHWWKIATTVKHFKSNE
jgi:ankyrin repeat protein